MSSTPLPFAESSLRALLLAVVDAWRAEPGADSAEAEPLRIYVDAFAGGEFRFGTGLRREEGCATRASEVLALLQPGDGSASAAPAALLVDEDPAQLQRIYASLEAAVDGDRIHTGEHPPRLQAGEVGLVEAPFAAVAAEVAQRTADAIAFHWLAPPAARELPWSALQPLLAEQRSSLLLRLPHSDFLKQAHHTAPLADLPGFARRMVEGCSALLDDPRHGWLAAWRAQQGDPAAALCGVAEQLARRLRAAAGERPVKLLQLTDAAGAALWLFLITPHPAVSLALNAAVHRLGLSNQACPDLQAAAPAADESVQAPALELFSEETPEPAPAQSARRPTAAEVAAGLLHRFGKQRVAWVDVLQAYAAGGTTLEELRAGLARLRRRGEAQYQGRLAGGAEIVFGEARPDPPRRRRRDAGLDLFGDSTEC